MRYLKPFLSAVVILALAVGVFAWLKATKPKPAPAQVEEKAWPVAVAPVRLATLRPERTVYAQVSVPQQVRVQAPFAAWVRELPVRPGDRLEKGALIARLDETDARALLTQAKGDVADLEAQIRIERANLAAQKRLVARKLASELSVQQLEAKLAQLAARLEKARARLAQVERDVARARLTAQTALHVVSVQAAAGEKVGAGQVLVTGFDPAELELAVVVPERLWRRAEGRAQVLELVDASGRAYPFARVAAERTPLGVKLWFSAEGAAWTLGDLVKLTLRMPPQADVAAVPYSALYGEDQVYVVEDGRLRRVKVAWLGEVSREDGTLALVRGVPDGARVLVTHLPNAIDGLKVAVRTEAD